MILKTYDLSELESKYKPLWWHEQGLSYTASGYGRKIPTATMVRLPDEKRWRRVYTCIFSNIGTSYVDVKGDWIVIHSTDWSSVMEQDND